MRFTGDMASGAEDRIAEMQREIEQLRADKERADTFREQMAHKLRTTRDELAEANHWRERHSKDAEAYGKQSQANWERAEKAERACAEMRDSVTHWEEFYAAELESCESLCKACVKADDQYGVNFHQGRRGGLVSHDIAITRLRDAVRSSTFGQGYVIREELRQTVQVLGRCIYNMETSKWPTNEAKQELARLQKLMEDRT